MTSKQRYLIIGGISVVFIVTGVLLYTFFGQTSLSEEEVLDDISESSTNEESEPNSSSSNAGGKEEKTIPVNILDFDAAAISLSDTEGLRYVEASTGKFFITEIGTEEENPQAELDLPGDSVSFVIPTDDNSLEKYIVYKQKGTFYSYDRLVDDLITLPSNFDYIVLDDVADTLYYLSNQSGVDSSIGLSDWRGRNSRIIIDKPGIQWMQFSRGSLYYRTSNQLFRYNLADNNEVLIASAENDIVASFSKSNQMGVVNIDNESYLYMFEGGEDVLKRLPFDFNPASTLWHPIERAFYNIKGDNLYKYNWLEERNYSWKLEEALNESNFDYENVIITSDGSILVRDFMTGKIIALMSYERME